MKLREAILNNLDRLLKELPSSEKEGWKDFLITVAERSASEDELLEALTFQMERLISSAGLPGFLAGIKTIRSVIADFPVLPVFEKALVALSEILEQKDRLIRDLREVLSQLAVPVIDIWEGVILIPVIGTLDSERAQRMTELLLNAIAQRKSRVAILDVSGLPLIDTAIGAHLIEAFNAVRLMGAEVVLTGIKPEIAQTLVKLGVGFEVNIQRDLQQALLHSISLLQRKKKERHEAIKNFGLE